MSCERLILKNKNAALGLYSCGKCKQWKGKESYTVNKNLKFGVHRVCRECMGHKPRKIPLQLLYNNREKGLYYCSRCNEFLSIDKFIKKQEKNSTCKNCLTLLNRKYLSSEKGKIYKIKRKYGDFNDEIKEIDKLIKEIKTINFDGLSFYTIKSFAKYLNKKYKINIDRTLGRIRNGHSPQNCLINEYELRSKRGVPIIAFNIKTNEITSFNSINSAMKSLKLGQKTIINCLKNKTESKLSRYKNKTIYKFEYDTRPEISEKNT